MTDDAQGFTDFEIAAMMMLLAGDHPMLAALRAQFAGARAGPREHTGVGFFVDILPGAEPAALPGGRNIEIHDVSARIAGMKRGVGLVLFVRDGLLSMLEAFTYDEPWAARMDEFSLAYDDGESRPDLIEYLDTGQTRMRTYPVPDWWDNS